MDGETLGWIGAIVGTIVGLGGASFGIWRSWAAAKSAEQKAFLRKFLLFLLPALVLFIVAVWFASTGYWPRWVYWVVMAAWFGGLPFAIRWYNRNYPAD